jgi:hypothetical protein
VGEWDAGVVEGGRGEAAEVPVGRGGSRSCERACGRRGKTYLSNEPTVTLIFGRGVNDSCCAIS